MHECHDLQRSRICGVPSISCTDLAECGDTPYTRRMDAKTLEALGNLKRTTVLKRADLDPSEKQEIVSLIDLAMQEGAYLRIEVVKVEPMPVTIVKANL